MMLSRERKKQAAAAAHLQEKLKILRSITHSHAVTVETLVGGHGGFLINVFSDKSCPGLLVSVLEAFDELGLSVLQATASCADSFRLEAVGGENVAENVDEHVVKQAVLQAIRSCSSSESGSEHDEE